VLVPRLRKPVGYHTQRRQYDLLRSISSSAIPLLSSLILPQPPKGAPRESGWNSDDPIFEHMKLSSQAARSVGWAMGCAASVRHPSTLAILIRPEASTPRTASSGAECSGPEADAPATCRADLSQIGDDGSKPPGERAPGGVILDVASDPAAASVV
jgi:hypothetical protein